MKTIPFILIGIGTLGLLAIEFIETSRYLTLIFAGLNVLGLTMLALTYKKSKV